MENANNNEDFVTIAKYSTSAEANLAKTKLEAEGIQCFVDNENYLYSRPLDYVNLKVWQRDKDKALAALNLTETPAEEEFANDGDDEIVVCPYCGSKDTRYGINRDATNTLFIVGAFFLQSLPWYKKKIYYCNACKRHFKVVKK